MSQTVVKTTGKKTHILLFISVKYLFTMFSKTNINSCFYDLPETQIVIMKNDLHKKKHLSNSKITLESLIIDFNSAKRLYLQGIKKNYHLIDKIPCLQSFSF